MKKVKRHDFERGKGEQAVFFPMAWLRRPFTGQIIGLNLGTQRSHTGSYYSPRQAGGHESGVTLQRLQSTESLSKGLRNDFSAALAGLISGPQNQCLYSYGLSRSAQEANRQINPFKQVLNPSDSLRVCRARSSFLQCSSQP